MKQAKIKIGDKEFTLQHPGIRWYHEVMDECRGINESGAVVLKNTKIMDKYLEHVIVEPKMTIEDFDNIDNGIAIFSDLMNECERFLTGQQLQFFANKGKGKE